jgi:hypothetical protein
MSNASTIAHYINVAAKGRELNGECLAELEAAINGLVDEAVRRAVVKCVPPERHAVSTHSGDSAPGKGD